MINEKFVTFDGLELNTYLYDTKKPKGIIQFIHGMQEHGGRYKEACEYFNKAGFICFVSDLRGHGFSSKSIEDLGKDDGDVFLNTVKDQIEISKMLKEKYPNLPLFVFGHSYGSFITQKYVQECDFAKAVIICGTTNGDNLIMKFGKIVAWFTKLKNGKHGKATMIENMSFKSYAKGFENGNWLSRDEKIWEVYNEDKYCGTPFPVSFYASLFRNMGKLNKGIKNINKNTPILLIYGNADPVGSKGKEIRKLEKIYLKNDIKIKCIEYENARHELLNETNKQDVLSDILNFMTEII